LSACLGALSGVAPDAPRAAAPSGAPLSGNDLPAEPSLPSESPLSGNDLPSEPSLPSNGLSTPSMLGSAPTLSSPRAAAVSELESAPTLGAPGPSTPAPASGVSDSSFGRGLGMGGSLPTVRPDFYDVEGEMARGGLGRISKATDKRLGRS